MNPLLARFVSEARDLQQAAGACLLKLERHADDPALIAEVFRAVHTLKGSSGLFDAAALTRVVHVAEDLLGEVRAGRIGLTPEIVDRLLASLDQVSAWVDELERHERLPEDADAVARSVAAGLKALLPRSDAPVGNVITATPADSAPDRTAADWLHMVAAPDRSAVFSLLRSGQPVLAVRYTPDEGCFYRGEDPLSLIRQVPTLLALHITAREGWPPPGELDPYRCNLQFHILTAAPRNEVEHMFRYVAEQAEIAPLRNEDVASDETAPGLLMPRLIAEQRRILAMPADGDQISKRLAAVVGTVRNLLQGEDLAVSESDLNAAAAEAAATSSPAPLVALLDRITPPESRVPAAVLAAAPAAEEAAADPRPAMRVLKVDQARVDHLMNLIGELVVSKNALPFLARRAEEVHGSRDMAREIKDQYAVIDRLAQEMQEAIMQVRMIPVSEVFERFPRLVRDLARKLAKKIELVVEGEDTAADKTIIEALGDPLLHIVRNAIDHGVELPDERRAAGKREHATISLAAWQEGDQVVIEVTDDGRGIDPACIRRSAIEKGVIDAEQAARLSDQEAVNLIFHAGFSTARQISDLSGRGVGMDVVRTTINRLGGQVGVTSRPGAGTRVRLSLPLSMAITRVMMVEAGGTLFGIPMDVIAETVRLPFSSIRSIKRVETFVLRNAVVPLVRLADLLGMTAPRAHSEAEAVLVVRLGGGSAGLVVDRFRESMDVILKPMDGMLAGMAGYAGTALLGDGRVLLVLNLRELL